MKLSAKAPGKVNLCLLLGGRQCDGRHELVTLLESVSLADELSLSTHREGGGDEVHCPGVEGPNLVAAALAELRSHGWGAPPVRIAISKRIPVAGGMGGGSADAAAALRLASVVSPVSPQLLAAVARGLGTDVPSQLEPGLATATAAGEDVSQRQPLGAHALLILPLPYCLSAKEVYAQADRLDLCRPPGDLQRAAAKLLQALDSGAQLPASLLLNDLQPAAISLCPAISGAIDAARQAGAEHPMVSGSGPTVFGLFWGAAGPERAQHAANSLARRFPGATSAVAVQSDFARPTVAAQSLQQP